PISYASSGCPCALRPTVPVSGPERRGSPLHQPSGDQPEGRFDPLVGCSHTPTVQHRTYVLVPPIPLVRKCHLNAEEFGTPPTAPGRHPARSSFPGPRCAEEVRNQVRGGRGESPGPARNATPLEVRPLWRACH